MFREELLSVSAEMDRRNDYRKIFITAFSRGVAETYFAVRDLPAEVKNRLIITCLGGILVMPRSCGFIVKNYISYGDWSSRTLNGLPLEYEAMKEMLAMHRKDANLEMLEQIDSNGMIGDHFFKNKTYQKVLIKEMKPLYEQYGVMR